MTDVGPNYCGTGADLSGVGTVTWSSPTGAQGNPGTGAVATGSTGNTVSHYLSATNFGFSIPGGNTVTGIQMQFQRFGDATDSPASDNSIKLIVGGAIVGNEKAVVGDWPTSYGYSGIYGANNDTWGVSLAVSDVNNSNFGVGISCNIGGKHSQSQINAVRITVTYTAGVVTKSGFFIMM